MAGLDKGLPLVVVYPQLSTAAKLLNPPRIQFEVKERGATKTQFLSAADTDLLARYALMFCVPTENPMASIRSAQERAEACKKALGIVGDTYANAAHVIDNHHQFVSELIQFWMMTVGQEEYQLWWTLKQQFSNYAAFLRTDPATLDETVSARVSAITKMMPDLVKQIGDLEAKLFVDKKTAADVALTETLYFYAERYAISEFID